MSDEEIEHSPAEAAAPPRPAWVKALFVLVALVALVALIMALSGGDHGPGRHASTISEFLPLA